MEHELKQSETHDVQTHERWDQALLLGATHVHARAVPLQDARETLEAALIRACQPPMNTHHR
jgi:hypothetical protein